LIVAEYDKEIISLAQQILGRQQPEAAPAPAEPKAPPPVTAPELKAEPPPPEPELQVGPPAAEPERKAEPPAPEPKVAAAVEARPEPAALPAGKETKTAEELARMIEADLLKHPQCPKKGLVVTVYGTTLWRAMLMITPAAGPVRDPQEWRDLTEQLAERLRQRYDLAWR
jgi:hypothetical protein